MERRLDILAGPGLFFRRWNGRLIGCILGIIALTGGCDDPAKPFTGDGLAGEYVLVSIGNWPLPAYDAQLEDTISSGRLRLWSDQTYEQENQLRNQQGVIARGLFFPRGSRVVLVPEDGRALAYHIDRGLLLNYTADSRIYLDASLEIPSEYRHTYYRAVSCSGRPPSHETPCPGGIVESRLWLGESGTYWLEDQRVDGTRSRLVAAYTVADNVIMLDRASNNRHVGTYAPATLTLDGWVYERRQ